MKALKLLILSGLFAGSVVHAESGMSMLNMLGEMNSYGGIKVAKALNNGINDDDEWKEIGLSVAEVNSFGIVYGGSNASGLGYEVEVLYNQDADLMLGSMVVGTRTAIDANTFITYKYQPTQMFYVRAKAGLTKQFGDLTLINSSYNMDETEDLGFAVGGGIGIEFAKKFGVIADYTHHSAAEQSTDVGVSTYMKF